MLDSSIICKNLRKPLPSVEEIVVNLETEYDIECLAQMIEDADEIGNYFQKDKILELEDGMLAKIFYPDTYDLAENELIYSSFLFNQGIFVPKPHGFLVLDNWYNFAPSYNQSKGIYLVTEKVEGLTIPDLDEEQIEEAIRLYRKEVEKVLHLGIVPGDSEWHENIIYNPKENKLYLIDFEDYSKESLGEIERFYSRIMDPKFKFRETSY